MNYFDSQTFNFLRQLQVNNNRDWFQENKPRFLAQVRDPFLQLIRDMSPELEKISPYYRGDVRTNGGSLFRVYRDTRFSKDKTPYKPWAGARFWHSQGGRRGAPLYYLHIQPDNVFMAAGFFHPESKQLERKGEQRRQQEEAYFRQAYSLPVARLQAADVHAGHDPIHEMAQQHGHNGNRSAECQSDAASVQFGWMNRSGGAAPAR